MTDIVLAKASDHSFVEWGAIIGGAVLASAISLVFLQFGAAIGLTATAPLRGEGYIGSLGVIATGIYLLWVQLLSSLAGGYLAGRTRRRLEGISQHEGEMRDGAHGLLSWALATIAFMAVAALATAIGALAMDTPTAQEIAEKAQRLKQNTTVIFAFAVGASSVVSAVVSWWAATKGGEHRDKNTDHSRHVAFRNG